MFDLDTLLEQVFLLITFQTGNLYEIVFLSFYVSFTAVIIAAIISLPLGAYLGMYEFKGSRVLTVTLNALMGLPPVVVGLVIYLMLSRSGPLGVFGLLYTPTAMIIAQVVLIVPIIASLTRQVVADLWLEYKDQLNSLGASKLKALKIILWDARYALLTALLAGFGRAIAEVGAVMIVGGNIDHVTRVMTTSIALEVSKGDLALALALGAVLIFLSLSVNAAVHFISHHYEKKWA